MVTVVSTRCTYTAHGSLPELTGAVPVEIADELLPLALALPGVVVVDQAEPAPVPPVPDPAPAAVPEPPAVAVPDPSNPSA